MSDSKNMLEEFSSYLISQLKDYLQVRGFPTGGNKRELVARAFAAWEQKAVVRKCENELQNQLSSEYNNRLKEHNLTDPINIPADKWSNDVKLWPKQDLGNIFSFLLSTKDYDADYIGKYKSQKAYSYFKSGFVGEILSTHQDNNTILKTKVSRSMSLNEAQHEVWVAVDKDSNVFTSWCSCIAGLSQTCNHVIAMLYKVEYATINGYIEPACTSLPCGWNKSTHRIVEPAQISKMDIRQDNRANVSHSATKSRTLNSELKRNFDPRRQDQWQVSNDSVSSLFSSLNKAAPKAVLFKCFPRQVYGDLPQSIPQIATTFRQSDEAEECFLEKLNLTAAQISAVENATKQQAKCDTWTEQRKGRLTSSLHHEVKTKLATIRRSSKTQKTSPLVAKSMGVSKDLSHLPAIKWGRENEDKARQSFILHQTLQHQGFSCTTNGLLIKKELPYIASSPDGICSCKCCGKTCLEIKCPFSFANPPVTVSEGWKKTDFLEETHGKLTLKKTHKYFTQVQSQMAITGCKKAFFVVWAPVGNPHIEQIEFDGQFWLQLQQDLVLFYKSYVVPFLLGKKELCICPTCECVCLQEDEIQKTPENSINCNCCDLWYHWGCADVKNDPKAHEWLCKNCVAIASTL